MTFGDEAPESELTPEDLFSMILLNPKKKIKTSVELRDAEGNKVNIADVIEELIDYVNKKIDDEEGNNFTEQIYPLIGQSMASTLSRLIGVTPTAYYLSASPMRDSFMRSAAIAFMLLKYIQQHKMTIHSIEEKVSDEEILMIEKRNRASQIVSVAQMLGANPVDIVKAFYRKGQLTKEEAEEFLGEPMTDGDLKSEEDNDEEPQGN